MATAVDTVQEGTTMSLCEACENVPPEMFCKDCPMKLCTGCVKIHRKVKVSSLHIIQDLSETNPDSMVSGECKRGLAKCSLHKEYSLELCCKECVLLICDECKPKHKDHIVERIKEDSECYQNICRKHVQSLYDSFHSLENFKKQVNLMVKTTDASKMKIDELENEVASYMKELADENRKELSDKRISLINIIEDPEKGLLKTLDDVDKGISTLQNTRKVSDCTALSHQLAESQVFLDDVKEYDQKMGSLDTIPDISDMFAYDSDMDIIKSQIHSLFTLSKWFFKYDPSKFAFGGGIFEKIDEIGLHAFSSKTSSGYKFCKYDDPQEIILHGTTGDLTFVNLIHRSIGFRGGCKLNIWNMACSLYAYLAKEKDSNTIHLINADFKSVDKYEEESGVKCAAILHHSNDKFIILSYDKSDAMHPKALIQTIKTKTGNIVLDSVIDVDVDDEPWYIDLDPKRENAYICTLNILYKVQMETEEVEKHDLASIISNNITSLYVDKHHNIFIADGNGSIHRFDPHFNHQVVLKLAEMWAHDIAVVDGRLVVSTSTNKILIYA